MIHKLKLIGIASVATLALTAITASAAHAVTTLTSGASSGKFTGVQVGAAVFMITPGTIQCKTYHQEISYTSSALTEGTDVPVFLGCKAFGFLTASITMNGCDFKVVGLPSEQKANSSVECPPGKEILVETAGCNVHFPAQQASGHITAHNKESSPPDILVTITTSGITYTETPGCPNAPQTALTHNGSFTATATIKAFNTEGVQVSLTVDP